MSDEQGYNGYTNYETWNVSLWLENDEGSYRHWWGRAQELKEEVEEDAEIIPQVVRGIWTAEQWVKYTLSGEIKEAVMAMVENVKANAGMFTDLLGHSVGAVDWDEVAEGLVEE